MYIMDNQLIASKRIHKFELDMIFWSKYVCGLYDYIMYNKLKPQQKKEILDEVVRVELHIDREKRKIETWLKKYNYSKENRLKIKKFYKDAKQSFN